MKRFPILATVALLLLTALPAVVNAQVCGGYGQPACPPAQPERPDEEDGEVETTTPCSTIVVQGDNWGSNTVIFIDREFDENCPGEGEPDDVLNDSGDDTLARSVSTAERTEVTAAEDGTFIAELRVPADAVGDYEVVISGESTDGTAKRQTYTYNVDPAANFTTNASTAASEDGNGPTMALAAVLAALILAVGFSWPSLVAKVRR